jgi:hypothetical protein
MPFSPETPPQKSTSISTVNKDVVRSTDPLHLNLYESNGDIHMTLSGTFQFGLFRKTDVKPGRPWIAIDAVVSERTNFSNGQSVRHLNVRLPELY